MEGDSRPAYRLACMEVWGGNRKIAREVELPDLTGWVYSAPLEPNSGGGDVCYFSVCDRGLLSRVALADVSGHGGAVGPVAEILLGLMRKYINIWDQSEFMQDLDREFRLRIEDRQYATVVVLGFFRQTGQLLYTSAGHHPLLWYHAGEEEWGWMDENSSLVQTEGNDLPVGLIPGTYYRQVAFKLAPADVLVLYTDGLSEATDEAGQELDQRRLLELAHCLPVDSPVVAGKALLRAVTAFRQGVTANDDQTLIVLQRRTTEEIHRGEGELQNDISSSLSGTSRRIFGNFSSAEESNANRSSERKA